MSVIVDVFQGQLRSHIRCLACGFSNTKFDTFMYLSLPVVDAKGEPLTTLQSCFREFSREECLSGAEQWYCPNCRRHVDAGKALMLWKVPPVLVLHLKRFRYDKTTMHLQHSQSQKLSHHVAFELEGLHLSNLGVLRSPQRAEPLYDLT